MANSAITVDNQVLLTIWGVIRYGADFVLMLMSVMTKMGGLFFFMLAIHSNRRPGELERQQC